MTSGQGFGLSCHTLDAVLCSVRGDAFPVFVGVFFSEYYILLSSEGLIQTFVSIAAPYIQIREYPEIPVHHTLLQDRKVVEPAVNNWYTHFNKELPWAFDQRTIWGVL